MYNIDNYFKGNNIIIKKICIIYNTQFVRTKQLIYFQNIRKQN